MKKIIKKFLNEENANASDILIFCLVFALLFSLVMGSTTYNQTAGRVNDALFDIGRITSTLDGCDVEYLKEAFGGSRFNEYEFWYQNGNEQPVGVLNTELISSKEELDAAIAGGREDAVLNSKGIVTISCPPNDGFEAWKKNTPFTVSITSVGRVYQIIPIFSNSVAKSQIFHKD